ncbi:MAG: methylcobalamin--homocysteine methyltransferase [Acidilobus sp.]
MELWAMTLGGYPRPREIRHSLRDVERGVIAEHESNWNLMAAWAAIVGAQEAMGFRFVTDGMVDWHDIFRPFVLAWRNVALDGLLRYFDNNFFYRVPVFLDRPDPSGYVWPPRIRSILPIAEPSPVKAVIPGPLTFTIMSKNSSGLSKEELAEGIASVLALEVQQAETSGAGAIQIDEPILSDQEITKDDARLTTELINSIISQLKVPTILSIYFDVPKEEVYREILEAKVTYLSLDVADAPKRALDLIGRQGFGGHRPILGVIDARRIEDDDLEKIGGWLSQALKGYDGDAGITTTTWFDVIPYTYSLRKTFLLGRYLEVLRGGKA